MQIVSGSHVLSGDGTSYSGLLTATVCAKQPSMLAERLTTVCSLEADYRGIGTKHIKAHREHQHSRESRKFGLASLDKRIRVTHKSDKKRFPWKQTSLHSSKYGVNSSLRPELMVLLSIYVLLLRSAGLLFYPARMPDRTVSIYKNSTFSIPCS